MKQFDKKIDSVLMARSLIKSYFASMGENVTLEGMQECLLISYDDDILLNHIKFWSEILLEAKNELENRRKS